MGFYHGPLGTLIDRRFEQPYNQHSMTSGRWALPGVGGEDLYELGFLQEAVRNSTDKFTMMELGCGYGRWLVNGAKLCAVHDIDKLFLIGVEASPLRFDYLKQHIANNNVKCDLSMYNMGVGAFDGTAFIAEDEGYGAALSTKGVQIEVHPLSYFMPDDEVDYLCMDIQGAEASVLESAKNELLRCRYVHVATHSDEVMERCQKVLADLPFECVGRAPKDIIVEGVRFLDGMEQWVRR